MRFRGFYRVSPNSSLNTLFDGFLISSIMETKVVRRIKLPIKTVDDIKRLRIKSFNAFANSAISEKLERDFNIKEKYPF